MPAPDFFGLFRVLHVEDHDDILAVALDAGRKIGVAPVEGEAVHPALGAFPFMDMLRVRRVGHVVDVEPAPEPVGNFPLAGDALEVGDHDVADHAYLVGMHALGPAEIDAGEVLRVFRVADVDDGVLVGRRHVRDVGGPAFHHHLPAARTVEIANLLQLRRRHECLPSVFFDAQLDQTVCGPAIPHRVGLAPIFNCH